MEVILAIRKLLFLEDCVIIPGLGGFVSQYRPAVIDKSTGTFIPPVKEIVFNGELVQNDGLLVSFLEKQDNITAGMAREHVGRFVDETRSQLESGKRVMIPGIGHFVQDKDKSIRFQTDAGTNLFLDSFGLAPVHLREIGGAVEPAAEKVLVAARDEKPVTVEFTVPLVRKSRGHANLRRIAIAMPLLIAFSLLPYNSRITDTLTASRASLIPEPSLYRLNYPGQAERDTVRVIEFPVADTTTVKALPVDTVVKAPEPAAQPAEVPAPRPEAISPSAGKFAVIAGCFKIRENAERLHKELVEKGYPAEIVPMRNGQMFKVKMQSFTTRKEAIDGLARLKKAEPGREMWLQ